MISKVKCDCRKSRSEGNTGARIMMQLDKAVEEVRS